MTLHRPLASAVLQTILAWVREIMLATRVESKYTSASLLRPKRSVSPARRGINCGMPTLLGVVATRVSRGPERDAEEVPEEADEADDAEEELRSSRTVVALELVSDSRDMAGK